MGIVTPLPIRALLPLIYELRRLDDVEKDDPLSTLISKKDFMEVIELLNLLASNFEYMLEMRSREEYSHVLELYEELLFKVSGISIPRFYVNFKYRLLIIRRGL